MSLYDRHYQNWDSRRMVGNGYNDAEGNLCTSPSSTANGSLSIPLNNGVQQIPPMATLFNIGNTCYLNSVIYTLRFAPNFLHNLHHLMHDLIVVQQCIAHHQKMKSASLGRGISTPLLDSTRSLSIKDLATHEEFIECSGQERSNYQQLVEKLHELYQSLHQNEMTLSSDSHHTDTLLRAVQEVNATFEGNAQQDAHEFLICLLNSIRETNEALNKAIADCPDAVIDGIIANVGCYKGSTCLEKEPVLSSTDIISLPANMSTKTSFFSRKSKRKDDLKLFRVARMQSPSKDSNAVRSARNYQTANSLFYLNTVDLSGNTLSKSSMSNSLGEQNLSDDEFNLFNSIKEKQRIEKIRELNLQFFKEDFEGIVVLTTKCLSCETVTEQKQGMLDISVPISGVDGNDFAGKPYMFIQNSCITRDYFKGENKYSCNQCTGYTEAIRSISYEVLPRLLLIQLNRFSGGMEKVNTYIPTAFTLPCFCVKCCKLADMNKLHVYKLYSVITHVGATLTVGHYIAYTCYLDQANVYTNCARDRRSFKSQTMHSSQSDATQTNDGSLNIINPVTAATSTITFSGTSLMKKMKFGRSKAANSGDISKPLKQSQGGVCKNIVNGIDKLSINTNCSSLKCCTMRLCNEYVCDEIQLPGPIGGNLQSSHCAPNNATREEFKANRGVNEPIWYQCDDDKVKAMTQREFEELLSPARKITITPYLLFYARFDLQPTVSSTLNINSGSPMPQSSSATTEHIPGGSNNG